MISEHNASGPTSQIFFKNHVCSQGNLYYTTHFLKIKVCLFDIIMSIFPNQPFQAATLTANEF